MKKIFSYVFVAVCAMIMVSCISKKAETVVNVEGVEITTEDIDELVKIASEIDGLKDERIDIKLMNGSIELSPEMKLVKPDYLMDPASINNLETMSNKICAIGILLVDKAVAQAYDMATEDYEASIARLFAETSLNIPFKVKNDELKDMDWASEKDGVVEYLRTLKDTESWEKIVILYHALAMEAIYIGNQNSALAQNFYTPEMTDANKKSIDKVVYALEKMSTYSESVAEILKMRQEVGKQFIEDSADVARQQELEMSLIKAQAYSNAIRMGMLTR